MKAVVDEYLPNMHTAQPQHHSSNIAWELLSYCIV